MLSRINLMLTGLITLSLPTVGCCNNFTELVGKMTDAGAVNMESTANQSAGAGAKEHERLDLCIECFNKALRISQSGNRYLKYLDGKEPGKARVPSVITPHSDTVQLCNKALGDKKPPLVDIDRTLPPFIESLSAIAPLLKQMAEYYNSKEYETDDFSTGKTFHESFKVEFEKYRNALNQVENALDVATDKKDKEQIAAASKNQNLHYHFLVFQYDAKQFINELDEDSPDTTKLAKLKDAVDAGYKKLSEYADSHPDEEKKVTLYTFYKSRAQDFIGRVRSIKNTKPTAKQVADIRKNYNEMIESGNRIQWR